MLIRRKIARVIRIRVGMKRRSLRKRYWYILPPRDSGHPGVVGSQTAAAS
jgi:hypothetical protein